MFCPHCGRETRYVKKLHVCEFCDYVYSERQNNNRTEYFHYYCLVQCKSCGKKRIGEQYRLIRGINPCDCGSAQYNMLDFKQEVVIDG